MIQYCFSVSESFYVYYLYVLDRSLVVKDSEVRTNEDNVFVRSLHVLCVEGLVSMTPESWVVS